MFFIKFIFNEDFLDKKFKAQHLILTFMLVVI